MYRFTVRDGNLDVGAHATVREAFEALQPGQYVIVLCTETGTRCRVLRP